ncbi:unnamed protein product [Hapterophycus canaliculatus]
MKMAEARGTCGDTVAPSSQGLEASLDVAEELFVSCRFTEASRVSKDALSSVSSTPPANGRTCSSSNISGDPASSDLMVAFDDQFIAPVADCDTSDLFVAVLLQCGFELQRTEEWDRCRAFYNANGNAMPFAVAILWLRLRLAGGEFELVRRVLWQLRAALANELQHRTLATTACTGRAAALANYSEATEMLIVQVMLPCGETPEASALVSNDAHLGPKERDQLLQACKVSSIHSNHGERQSQPTEGGGTIRDTSSAAITGDGSSRPGVRGRGAATGGPWREDHTAAENFEPQHDSPARHRQGQQGVMQKLFCSVSDWTPEARIQLVVGAGAAGLAAYATLRNRDSLWRAARSAAGVAVRTAGDIGGFIVGSS